MNPWRLLKLLVGISVLGGGGYAAWRFRPTDKPEAVTLGTVERGDLTLKVTVAGGVVPRRKALITPPYNGYLRKLFVKVGDHIKSGAPVVSVAESVGVADTDVFPLRSPITGEVVQVWRSEGEYVSTTPQGNDRDATIVRIDDITKLFVQANVAEIEVGKLKIGLPVVIRALAVPSRSYHGKITEITEAAREGDRWEKSRVEFPITVEVSDPDPQMKPGMSAVLDVIVKEAKGVLTLRHEYVQRTGKDYSVTMADGSKKTVEVGLQNEDAFEITTGVAEGDKVKLVDFLAAAPGP